MPRRFKISPKLTGIDGDLFIEKMSGGTLHRSGDHYVEGLPRGGTAKPGYLLTEMIAQSDNVAGEKPGMAQQIEDDRLLDISSLGEDVVGSQPVVDGFVTGAIFKELVRQPLNLLNEQVSY